MNSPKRRILAGAFILTLVAAACGSDSSSSSSSTDAAKPTDNMAATTDAMTPTTEAMTPTTDGAATAPVSGTLVGSGSSAQAAAMTAWQAGFQAANPDATVEYDPVGSGGGRDAFLAGGATDFAGSDAALKADEYTKSIDRCAGDKGAINLPHYVSPIALPYNLPSLKGKTLNLTPAVIGGIFNGSITKWNDPLIVADNPDLTLPDTTVNPVHRSDKSGTTKNFTDYLTQAAPDVWTTGVIEAWDDEGGPTGGEGGAQTSGVIAAVTAGEGSIGYADASQIGDLPAAAVGVAGDFVEPSSEAAAKIVDSSERVAGPNPYDYTIKVNRTPDSADVYPIVLVSYHIVCLQYDSQAKVDLVKAFMSYVGSDAGQQAAADAAGSAPLSADVQAAVAESVAAISVGS